MPSNRAIRQHQHQQQPTRSGATSSHRAGASASHRFQLFRRSLVEGDLDVWMLESQACDRGGNEPGERGRKRSDAQSRPLTFGGGGKLRVGELEALGDGVGMLKPYFSLAGEPE